MSWKMRKLFYIIFKTAANASKKLPLDFYGENALCRKFCVKRLQIDIIIYKLIPKIKKEIFVFLEY